jgi:hypothetical protein
MGIQIIDPKEIALREKKRTVVIEYAQAARLGALLFDPR